VAPLSGIPDPHQTTPTSEGVLPPTEPIPELQKLGSTLAAARHQRGIDLELMAERLRIGASQLRALETGDHTHLPEGVFVIALARRVAGALDLNIDEAVQALRGSRLMVRPLPRPSLPPAPPRRSKPSPTGPLPARREVSGPGQFTSSGQSPTLWLWGLPLVLGALGLAAALGFNFWQHHSRAARPGSAAADANRAAAPPDRPKVPVAASTAAPPPAAPSKLRLKSSEPSWIQVRQNDGKVIFEGTLTGEQTFPLGQGLEVLAGRPYAVLAAVGDGPARPLGPVDDLSWHRFSPKKPALTVASPTALPNTAPTETTTDSPSQSPKPQSSAPATAAP
jgi:transcriptional regulator with XRE-family HTH domain